MKVLLKNLNRPLDVEDGYGMRLIEQGKAVPAPSWMECAKGEAPKKSGKGPRKKKDGA